MHPRDVIRTVLSALVTKGCIDDYVSRREDCGKTVEELASRSPALEAGVGSDGDGQLTTAAFCITQPPPTAFPHKTTTLAWRRTRPGDELLDTDPKTLDDVFGTLAAYVNDECRVAGARSGSAVCDVESIGDVTVRAALNRLDATLHVLALCWLLNAGPLRAGVQDVIDRVRTTEAPVSLTAAVQIVATVWWSTHGKDGTLCSCICSSMWFWCTWRACVCVVADVCVVPAAVPAALFPADAVVSAGFSPAVPAGVPAASTAPAAPTEPASPAASAAVAVAAFPPAVSSTAPAALAAPAVAAAPPVVAAAAAVSAAPAVTAAPPAVAVSVVGVLGIQAAPVASFVPPVVAAVSEAAAGLDVEAGVSVAPAAPAIAAKPKAAIPRFATNKKQKVSAE